MVLERNARCDADRFGLQVMPPWEEKSREEQSRAEHGRGIEVQTARHGTLGLLSRWRKVQMKYTSIEKLRLHWMAVGERRGGGGGVHKRPP